MASSAHQETVEAQAISRGSPTRMTTRSATVRWISRRIIRFWFLWRRRSLSRWSRE